MQSQNEAILAHLERGHSITPLEALRRFGCFALNSRISQLRNDRGFDIDDAWVRHNGKRYKKYFLPEFAGRFVKEAA